MFATAATSSMTKRRHATVQVPCRCVICRLAISIGHVPELATIGSLAAPLDICRKAYRSRDLTCRGSTLACDITCLRHTKHTHIHAQKHSTIFSYLLSSWAVMPDFNSPSLRHRHSHAGIYLLPRFPGEGGAQAKPRRSPALTFTPSGPSPSKTFDACPT